MQLTRLTTRSKSNEACEKFDDLKEGGMPKHVTVNKLRYECHKTTIL